MAICRSTWRSILNIISYGSGVAIAVTACITASDANAIDTSPELYDCRPKPANIAQPPPQPKLPPKVSEELNVVIASDAFRQVCPDGEVPYPTLGRGSGKALRFPNGRNSTPTPESNRPSFRRVVRPVGGTKRRLRAKQSANRIRPRGAKASRWWDGSQSAWYSWAGGEEPLKAETKFNGLWMSMTNEQPYIPYGESLEGSHSLAQMWGTREWGGCTSYVETGWTESAGQFNGNYEPHLFISAWDCGAFLGYTGEPGVPWVQSSPYVAPDRKSTRLNSSHTDISRMPSS